MSTTSTVLRTGIAAPKLAAAVAACTIALTGALAACGSKTQQQAAAPAANAQTGTTEPATAGEGPAPAVTEASWSPDALQQLVAPIALYPDQLVGQILTASVNSQEVLDAGNWLLQNQSLKGDQLDAAAQKVGFGPATRALVQFPQVIDMMCQEIDWTRQLGAAFTSDQGGVLAAVQELRAQAVKVGNLETTPQQKVETKTENEKTIIEVKPADPQIVYVPQYNPQVIYTTPPPAQPPAAAPASTEGTVSTGAAVAGGLMAFGVGMLIGSAIHNDDCCYPHYGVGAVYVGPRPFYPPAYAYHPAYGPAFRPATAYVSPANYRYNYNNINRNVNVNVNNNYFNQFNRDQNLRANNQGNLSGATRNTSNWKGQSTYAGARPSDAQSARFNEAMGRPANAGPSGSSARGSGSSARESGPGSQSRVGGAGSTRNPALASNRTPSGGSPGGRGAAADTGAGRAVDRGYGAPDRGAGSSGLGAARDANGPGTARDSGNLSRPAESPAARSGGGGSGTALGRDSAFSGAGDSGGGGFARSASARGHASTGGLGGGGHAGGGRRR
jgi:hypothetical protein